MTDEQKNNIKLIAEWVVHDCSDPVDEISWILGNFLSLKNPWILEKDIDDFFEQFPIDKVQEYLDNTFIINEVSDGDNRLDSLVCSLLNKNFIFDNIDHVLVQGDTTSAFAVALAAFHRNIPVIHLEAGLRTFNRQHPYPEEFNRTAISSLASIHLCPTETSAKNVRAMVGTDSKIYVTGNTVLDNLYGLTPTVSNKVLVTMHRRENHNQIEKWFREIDSLAEKYNDLEFILPIHPNPNIYNYKNILTHVNVVDPLSYDECIDLIRICKTIITDSGGIQEESAFLKKKCIVCREISERSEGIGTFAYMCQKPDDLSNIFESIINSGQFIVDKKCPYGDGQSSYKILKILNESLQ